MTVGAAELGFTVHEPAAASYSRGRETWARFRRNRGAVAGLAIVLVYVGMAVPLISIGKGIVTSNGATCVTGSTK